MLLSSLNSIWPKQSGNQQSFQMVLVKFFASSADIVGQRQMQFEVTEEESVSSFLDRLCEAHPRLAGLRPAMRVAVNHEYVDVSFGIRDGDEVALIPPVSGGS